MTEKPSGPELESGELSPDWQQQAAFSPGEARVRLALAAGEVGDWHWNAASDSLELSPIARRLLGIEKERSLVRSDLLTVIPPDDIPRLQQARESAIAKHERYEIEHGVHHADGRPAWLVSSGLPIFEGDRLTGVVGVVRDVTERRQAEEKLAVALQGKEALLREVNHRVKNSLQLVMSVLALQARASDDPMVRQSLAEAESRIAIIASLHRSLYVTGQHDRIELADQLREVARTTMAAFDPNGLLELRESVEASPSMPVETAEAIVLIVCELLTNAVKYAYGAGAAGVVHLNLSRDGDSISLSVADEGSGLPPDFDMRTSAGFGMRIITALVRKLGGELSIFPRFPGVVFTVSFPLPERTDDSTEFPPHIGSGDPVS